jgi:hypothetical protein
MKVSFLYISTALAFNVVKGYLYDRKHYEVMFYDYIINYNITIENGDEFARRLDIFATNSDDIESYNKQKDKTLELGINEFTHLTLEEFHEYVNIGCCQPPDSLDETCELKEHDQSKSMF